MIIAPENAEVFDQATTFHGNIEIIVVMVNESAVSRWTEIVAGFRASLAAGLGMFPLGIAYGLLVMQAGLPWWVAPALSVAAFAGSLELLLIGMMVDMTPLATIALTTFLVNFRHVFYAFTFPLHVVCHPLARGYSVYALIDEAFAVTAARPDGWTSWRLLSLQIAFQIYWVMGGLTGVLIGSVLPMQIAGLDFALCALFVTLTLDACRTQQQVPSLLLAGASFSFALIVTPDMSLFTGLLVFVGSLIVRFSLSHGKESDHV